MAEKATSLDVARLAGVSQSAVSRVFTPGASASKKTLAKVRKAADALDYRPNALARAMITGKSRIIGLVVAYLDNFFYPVAVERLSVALQQQGYHILVFIANSNRDVDHVMAEIVDYQVDGIVLASVAMSSGLAARCRTHAIPVVLFNRDQDDPSLSCVTTENVAGGHGIAEFLVATGHRRIAYVAGYEGASTQRDRETGFRAGLTAAGLTLHSRACGDFRHPQSREATLQMFDRPNRPDAVFVANDHMAFAVMDCLRSELGLHLPRDVSVVGFDDVPIAAWPAYDLTTWRQPLNRMVAETVTILMERIAHPDTAPRRIRLGGRLILRGSSRNERTDP